MERIEQLQALNKMLLAEMPEYREQARTFPREKTAQRRLLRSLINVRPPMPLEPSFPAELVPRCPRCGRPMTMNLRCDGTFVDRAVCMESDIGEALKALLK